jgi:hypothetical protein
MGSSHILFSYGNSIHHRFFVIGCAGGYIVSFFIEIPLEIVISPSLQPMNALEVDNEGLPKILGCPL